MSEAIQLAILGATGSIGRQALEVVRAHPERLRVVALGANRNAEALRDLAAEFPSARTALGANALAALATDSEAELVLVATPGVAALRATIAALSEGKRVALANKGYEAVEARWLYGLPYERIDVVYRPESVVHALVEYVDGSVKAQLAEPDMRLPIQYALLWDRAPSPAPRFDWSAGRTLHFGAIELARYPCFAVVLETARSGDLAAMVGLSAADEVAVERFLRGDIPFTDIPALLRRGADP